MISFWRKHRPPKEHFKSFNISASTNMNNHNIKPFKNKPKWPTLISSCIYVHLSLRIYNTSLTFFISVCYKMYISCWRTNAFVYITGLLPAGRPIGEHVCARAPPHTVSRLCACITSKYQDECDTLYPKDVICLSHNVSRASLITRQPIKRSFKRHQRNA